MRLILNLGRFYKWVERNEWHFTSPTIGVRQVRLIKISDMGSGTHCLEHEWRKTHRPAFHLTFSCELTQHITEQLMKWICFRSSALTPVFQGAEIRSTVTEECLQNKNWCITSWKAGWRWSFSGMHAADPDLYSIQYGSPHMCVCSILPNGEKAPLVTMCHGSFHLIWIAPVFVVLLHCEDTLNESAFWFSFPSAAVCLFFISLSDSFYFSYSARTCACFKKFPRLFSLD